MTASGQRDGKPKAAQLSAELAALLLSRGKSLAVAESLTGGLLSAAVVDVPGISEVYRGGIVAYDTQVKISTLGVDAQLVAACGVVSAECAAAMAVAVRELFAVEGQPSDLGISTTGVAGPESQEGKEVGTVFIGVSLHEHTEVLSLRLSGTRDEIQHEAVRRALEFAQHQILEPA